MSRWKTLVLATASFGLLSGVAIAQEQPDPQTNPPIEDKTRGEDEVKKNDDSGKLPDDINKGEGMGTEPGKGLGTDTDKPKVDEPKVDETTKPDENKAGDTKPDETKAGDDIKGEKPETKVDVNVGGQASKMQIQNAQTKLKEQGLYKGEVDGLIGPRTKAAVKQFQQSKGLTVNGQLDDATLNAMGASQEQAPAQPAPKE